MTAPAKVELVAGGLTPALWTRLRMVRDRSHDIGYGVGEDMDALLTGHGADD